MSPLPYIALLLVLTAVFLTLVISALHATCPRHAAQAHPLSAIVRHSTRTRAAAVLLALAATAAAYLSGHPEGVALFGIVGLTVLLLGERLSPAVMAPERTASLARRRISDYLPTTGLVLLLLSVLALAADAAVGLPVTASDPWQAPGGPTLPAGSYFLGVSTASTGEAVSSAYTPWPGPRVLVPLAVSLAIQLAASLLALRRVTTRGQVGSRPGPLDQALRRYLAEGALGLLLVSAALPLPLLGVPMIEAATWEAAGWDYGRGTVGGVGIVVAVASMVYGAVLLSRSPQQVSA
ncbi:MAG: hypothetical protein SO046_08035 [Actinomyces urogenitalis]|uniref:hypothetical protein n=1 Tax=Actinomyces urogenitalis TaxID=103621 RepID=UPI002A837DF6|nr:hypothetical protein [Actinomyces urogenitalis]MDY3679144.1 hypothetical protein [Actinomyces urogenitalis]